MEEGVKLSVIAVCNDSRSFTELGLYSVSAATYGLDAELFFIDNATSGRAADTLSPLFPAVTFIRLDEKLPVAEVHRRFFPSTAGEYVLLLDAGLVVGEDVAREFCYFMDEHPAAGAAGPQMLDAHGRFVPASKRCFPSRWTSFCRRSGLSYLFPASSRFNRYHLPALDRNRAHRVDVVSGACMLLRRSAVEAAGWPDDAGLKYGEDVALAMRLARAGALSYYLPQRVLDYGERSLAGQVSHRRLLLIAYEESLRETKAACTARLPGLEFVNWWNLGENRLMDAINRSNRMKGFTDIAVCYPDVRFEQLLLLMDKMDDTFITYHIYNKKNGVLLPLPEER